MRSLRSPVPTWLRRSAAMAAACSSCARSRSRAFSTRMAFARFLICERSSWQVTTSPVGICVIRTAESVVFTPLPAGTGRAIHVHADVLLFHLDVHVLGFGQDGDRHRGGVGPAARLRLGHALHAMDAPLE